jgi:DNA polymerase-3 subunit beta
LPILKGVRLCGIESGVRLTATDLNMTIEYEVRGDTTECFDGVLPGRMLAAALAAMPDGSVTLRADYEGEGGPATYHITGGPNEVWLNGYRPADFPKFERFEGGQAFTVKASSLIAALGYCRLSAAQDDARPILTGIDFDVRDGKIRMAASDGFRLTVATIPVESLCELKAIVPVAVVKPLKALVALDPSADLLIRINPTRTQMAFTPIEGGSWALTAQIIQGIFPSLKALISTEHTSRVIVNRDAFLQAVKLASLFARDGSRIIRLNFTSAGGLEVGARADAMADAIGHTQIRLIASVEGDGMIAFNVRYLSDIVGSLSGDVVLETTGRSSAAVFRAQGPVTGVCDLLHALMPMFVQW